MKKKLKSLFLNLIIPVYYQINCKLIKENYDQALILEVHENKISFSSSEMYKELIKREIPTKVFFVDELNKRGRILRYFKSLKYIASSHMIFLTDGYKILNHIDVKDKKIIQLWHASGIFKKFGYSTSDNNYGNNNDWDAFPIHKNYSLVSVSSEYVVPFYEEALDISNGTVKPFGSSRTDYYFDPKNKQKALHKMSKFKNTGKKIIVYAPTFRGRLNQHQSYNLDIRQLKRNLSESYILLLKMHPLIKSHDIKIDNEFAFDVSDEFEFSELVLTADICITDYSSVIFDWSLSKKPIISYAPDWKEYNNERGLYENYSEFFPGKITKNMEELLDVILLGDYDYDLLEKFRIKYMGSCDGKSTNRVLDYILEK